MHGFSIGDSAETWKKSKWQEFDSHLQKVRVIFCVSKNILSDRV